MKTKITAMTLVGLVAFAALLTSHAKAKVDSDRDATMSRLASVLDGPVLEAPAQDEPTEATIIVKRQPSPANTAPAIQEVDQPQVVDSVIDPAHSPEIHSDHGIMQPAIEPVWNQTAPVVAGPVVGQCHVCCAPRCRCCPPPPIPTTFCLVDPCGCTHEACIEVPACCAGEEPCITWRGGLLGRKVATLCWTCCDHKVKVIVCRSGKVKVRD